jgi:adenine phosphoribosyltransferase
VDARLERAELADARAALRAVAADADVATARGPEKARLDRPRHAGAALVGGAVAQRLGIGVLAIRKGGKLPPPVHSRSYTLEYGTATLEIPAGAIDLAGVRVAIIDDVLATGGSVAATRDLLSAAGARLTPVAVVVELSALNGRDRVAPLPVHSLQRV